MVTSIGFIMLLTMCRDRTELAIGDENPLMLTIMAANHGEGAYESELVVRLPPEADYNGMERRREVNYINPQCNSFLKRLNFQEILCNLSVLINTYL